MSGGEETESEEGFFSPENPWPPCCPHGDGLRAAADAAGGDATGAAGRAAAGAFTLRGQISEEQSERVLLDCFH